MKYLLLCVAALLAGPALAQSGATTSSQPAGTEQAAVQPDEKPEKLICRKQEVIGSLIAKKRVCATARNWERNETRAKDHLEILTAPGAFAPGR